MLVSDLQLKLHQTIDGITDSKKLMAIYALLKGEAQASIPMSLEEYVQAIDEAREDIKSGKFTDLQSLEKESESW
ncbi:MAG: hypothetical protein Q8J69_07150 [Sphingobacteriaceae bacterium]|nr:hypothetical protein [Sphingobacteriaceae bacterium]